jgi:peptide/nickel transport system substrate-binding protein
MVDLYRRGVACIALVALALLAGACGGSDGNPSGSTTPPTPPAERLIDINPKPRDQVKDGGTMRWPLDQFPTQYNFGQLDGTSTSTNEVTLALMPYPFISDEHANVTPNPDFVTSADVTTTGKQVVTLKLNPTAKWSDGRPITWEDYQTQWKALRGVVGGYSISTATGYERIGSVEKGADQYEVVISFDRPFGEWKALFTPLYPKQTQDTPEHFNTSYANHIPVTAGPFKLDEIDETGQTMRVVRDPRWWGNPAKLDAINFSSPEIDAQTNAFANGEVDRVNLTADASSYRRASHAAGGVVRTAAGPDFRHFTINGTSPLLKDVAVRRAVALALNRAAIAKSDLTGLNWPSQTMNNHFFVNSQDGYQDDSGEYGRFDPAKAKSLLDAAGWKQSGAFRTKGGKTLKLRFVIPGGVAVSRQEGELAQAMLRDVGIQLDVQTVPVDDLFTKYINIGSFDLAPFSWIGTAFPISGSKTIYTMPKKDKTGKLQIQQNYARIGSPEIDRLMASAEQQVDIAKARDLVNQADKLIWDEVHTLILFQRPQNIAVNAKLANVGAFGFKSPAYQDMGFER